jgi:membrane associated rhomboid family serine protease
MILLAIATCVMPAERNPLSPLGQPDTPTMIPRFISAALILASLIAVIGFLAFSGRALLLAEKMTIAIIALGGLAGLLHAFGVVPEHRQMRAFASPVVAWPVMLAGMVTLFTS